MAGRGIPGPLPKRSEQRRRTNKPMVEPQRAPAAPVVKIPDPDPDWLPIALSFYESLKISGQSHWYEPSDWVIAHYTASLMSISLRNGYPALVARVQQGFTALLATEGDRRRMRIELERAKAAVTAEMDGVSDLGSYRDRLAG